MTATLAPSGALPITRSHTDAEPRTGHPAPGPGPIPPVGPDSLGRDAILPRPQDTLLATGSLTPLREVLATWRAQIQGEALVDVRAPFYRSPTATAPKGLHLRTTDGALMRTLGPGKALALQRRAWGQLLGLLMAGAEGKPHGSGADAFAWLSPPVRALAFAEVVARSPRKEGASYPILYRTHLDPRTGLRAVRACLSGQFPGVHFDDAALIDALTGLLDLDAPAAVTRTLDVTTGYALIPGSDQTRGLWPTRPHEAGLTAVLFWRNSETGGARIGFSAGCRIEAVGRVVRFPRTDVEADTELPPAATGSFPVTRAVPVALAGGEASRVHRLPTVGKTENQRRAIAQSRMAADVRTATARAVELIDRWGQALQAFPRALPSMPRAGTEREREEQAQVITDVLQENREVPTHLLPHLRRILTGEPGLATLPWGSAAYMAATYALLSEGATDPDERHDLQLQAGAWITDGWGRS